LPWNKLIGAVNPAYPPVIKHVVLGNTQNVWRHVPLNHKWGRTFGEKDTKPLDYRQI
jgi:hypothetical protein